jgi:glycosyltransferase involved in cell wall biosynthesis
MLVDRPLFDHVLNQPARFQPPTPLGWGLSHLNIVIASLALGGAERCVLDVVHGLKQSGGTGVVYVLNRLAAQYLVEDDPAFPVVWLDGNDPVDQMRTIAAQVLCSPTPVVVSHLIRTEHLKHLWRFGLQTIPVIHNSSMGWHEPVSNFDTPHVPFIVAVSDDVKTQLREASCGKPVCVIRHEIQRWKTAEDHQRDRAEIRAQYGVGTETTLIGMVGQFKAHKSYVRAVRVLAALKPSRNVKLMIVGGWDHKYGSGRQAHAATVDQARMLGVLDDVIFVGPTQEATKYLSAFDVFLNTSIYEGLSIACLEAAQLGCPLVLSDVGGQREVVTDAPCRLVSDPSDIAAYVRAIETLPGARPASPLPPPKSRHLIPQLWSLIADQAVPAPAAPQAQTLFVTSNLNPGGAQRSLTNLLVGIGERHASWLCVVDRILGDEFVDTIRSTPVGLAGVSAASSIVDKAREILVLAKRLGVKNIVFWNVDSALKLVIAKALENQTTTLIDVSPGPMLFDELDNANALQRRIAFDAGNYLNRLDHFVSKYHGGVPPERLSGRPKHFHVIPNGVGVPPPRNGDCLPIRPAETDPRYALVSCCRIVPNKLIETLVEMMTHLSSLLPAASLTIVGGVDQRHVGYFEKIRNLIAERKLDNIFFVGPCGDVFSFLDQFKVFVMMSKNQGCPNASLEAMAMGLPVIANPDGGTAEQVLHGQTGFLVDADDPACIASQAMALLTDDVLAQKMGRAGRDHARNNFSLDKMTAKYLELLER